MNSIVNLLNRYFVYFLNRFHQRENDIWVFGEWFGKRCGDNSAYLANAVAKTQSNLKLYWIAKSDTSTDFLDKRIKVLEMDSDDSISVLKKAKVLVCSQGLGDFSSKSFNYFGNAITLNLWHGVMWKRVGHDADYRSNSRLFRFYCSLIDKVQSAKYYLVTADIYEKVFISAFGANNKRLIKAGYPRNYPLYDETKCLEVKDKLLRKLGVSQDSNAIAGIKIITYMPTFRDKKEQLFDFGQIIDNENFSALLKQYGYILIQKAHYVNQTRDHDNNNSNIGRLYNINDIMAQELLCATDILITDYSGCFFDYLLRDKPIIHFLYDYDYYKNSDRGLYFSAEDVAAGPIVYNEMELISEIEKAMMNPNVNGGVRLRCRDRYMQYESENSTKIIIDRLLNMIGEN